MNRQPNSKSGYIIARNLFGVLLCIAGISIAAFSVSARSSNKKSATIKPRATLDPTLRSPSAPVPNAPTPAGGTLTSANIGPNNAINYTDSTGSLVPNLTFFAGNGTCAVPMSCSTFTLTIDPSVAAASAGYDPTKYQIFIQVRWAQGTEDYDTWMCSGSGNCTQANVVASNTSTADPETIILPTNTAAGPYTINLVNTSGAAQPINGTIYLSAIPQQTNCTGDCTPPRYINYPAGQGQADDAGEPSLGVDWNPNVASLKDVSSSDFTTGTMHKNTGGVAFFKSGGHNWRVNFDDCPSPAVNVWDDVSATFDQQFVLTDPIGFVDHYSSSPLGVSYPPPHTPGRVFTIDLIGGQGNSLGAFSDDDGGSYTPGGNGGPGQGPDHESLGGGPYNPNSVPPPPPQAIAYGSPNAVYYCSQDIVAEAECSRSDDGGQTFGPGVIIYNPATCTGGIHGHIKVAPDGTVYVPNSSCGENGGTTGVAVSIDNGLTWTQNNVPLSSSTQDPSVAVGQNGVGRPAGNLNGTNTIYLGYVDGDSHAKVAHSGDRGAHWSTPVDVGAVFGVTHAVFPVAVAGDDNRAAFGFLGTGDGVPAGCDPYSANLNCSNIWHLYIATTYDGGNNWITVDATPNDPVQIGTVCLAGTTCSLTTPNSRNLADFNDFTVDSEGRAMLGYADGCVNCNNGQTSQSFSSHGTVARQSGGRRLFAFFDPVEPAAPAAPQMVSAVIQSSPSGNLVTWLEPDNGGSPITGYNVYRGTSSGGETLLAHVAGDTNTKYLDTAAPAGNVFYYVRAINAIGEGEHCGEVSTQVVVQTGNSCSAPYVAEGGAGAFQPAPGLPTDPTMGQLTLQRIGIGEPFSGNCSEKSITFQINVQELNPQPLPNGIWRFFFFVKDTTNTSRELYVSMDTGGTHASTPFFNYGYRSGGTTDQCSSLPGSPACPVSGTFNTDGTITIKLDVSQPLDFFSSTNTTGVPDFIVNIPTGTHLTNISGETYVIATTPVAGAQDPVQVDGGSGSYTTVGNLSCNKIPPIAELAANPTSGAAPLTVNFNGTPSHEQTGSCGVINSYTLDFGDGSAPVTNNTGTFSHTYSANGDYPARLTVSDTVGQTSSNPAEVVISVGSNSIQPVAVVSRKTHGSITPPFEINLPLTGTPGIECRSGGANGNYTMVFKFANPLTSVGSASVTTGTGSVGSAGISPNANEYVVNLTGVTDAQYIAVTLTNVQDSVGNSGNVIGPRMGVLVGDTNADGFCDAIDTSQTKSQSGNPVTNSNFREDVNADGFIDAVDTSLVKSKSGTALP